MAFDPITAIFNTASTVLDKVLPDKKANDAAKAALAQMQLSGELQAVVGQLEINKAEAQNGNWFVAGWRPAIGWVCALTLFSNFIVRPLFMFIARSVGHPIEFPALDLAPLMTLLGGMLGFGTMRTVEKIQGVDTKSIGGS